MNVETVTEPQPAQPETVPAQASMTASTIVQKVLADMDMLDGSDADSEFEFDMEDDD